MRHCVMRSINFLLNYLLIIDNVNLFVAFHDTRNVLCSVSIFLAALCMLLTGDRLFD